MLRSVGAGRPRAQLARRSAPREARARVRDRLGVRRRGRRHLLGRAERHGPESARGGRRRGRLGVAAAALRRPAGGQAGRRPLHRADGADGVRRPLRLDLRAHRRRPGLRQHHAGLRHLPERPDLREVRPRRRRVRLPASASSSSWCCSPGAFARSAPMRTSGTSGRSWSIWKSVFAVILVLPFVYPLWFLVATATRDADAYNVSPLGFYGVRHLDAPARRLELGRASARARSTRSSRCRSASSSAVSSRPWRRTGSSGTKGASRSCCSA